MILTYAFSLQLYPQYLRQEKIYMLFEAQMDKETVVYIQKRILPICKI